MREIAVIDLGIIIMFLVFLVRGFQQGLIRQTMALLGLLLGLKIASDQYQFLSIYIQTHFTISPSWANIVSFALILIVVILVVNLVGWLLHGLTKVLFLSFVDRVVGAILGLVKGGIVIYLILVLVSKIPYTLVADQLAKSTLARDLLALTPYIEANLERIINP